MRHAIATLILAAVAVALWWYWSTDTQESEVSAVAEGTPVSVDHSTTRQQQVGQIVDQMREEGLSEEGALLRAQIALRRRYFDPIEFVRVRAIDRDEGF